MKGILITIGFIFCLTISFAQAPVNRSSSAITAVDAKSKVSMTFSIPTPNDTTLVGGLDSVGSILYARNYSAFFIRDTFPGGKKWTRVLKSGDAGTGVTSFNTRTGTVALLSADVTTALGYTPPNPNGTNLQYIAGDGSKITFPSIPAQFNPSAGYGILIGGSYPNKSFTLDTNTVFPAIRATILTSSGITSLNGLTSSTQTFSVGTSGSNFNIQSAGSNHAFNIPIVSGTNTGLTTPTLFNTWNAKWGLTGNAGTVDGTNFIGTTDNVPLSFKVNNQTSGRITSSGNQTYFGYQSGNGVNSLFTTAIGYQSLQNNTGNYNSALGYQSLQSNTSGNHNVAIGYRSLQLNTTGVNSVAIGDNALSNNTIGTSNVAVGSSAFNNLTTAQFGASLGWDAAGSVTIGDSTVAIGAEAGFNVTTGHLNTFLGTHTGWGIITGNYNTVIGSNVTGLSPTLNNNIILADGLGNQRLRIDSFGTAIFNSTKALGLPTGTTAQRPSSPAIGYIRYNTDSVATETWNGIAWVKAGAGGGGGGGSVTSVGSGFGLLGGPITGTGTLVFDSTSGGGFHTQGYNDGRYQGKLTLTTTGSSGPSTLVGNTLNIPQYSGGGGSVAVRDSLSYINGAKFGMVGDGVTDNSTVLQGLINAGKRQIYIPKGVYVLDSTIQMKDSVTIWGDGYNNTIFKLPNNFTALKCGFAAGGKKCMFSDFGFSGTYGGVGNTNQKGIVCDSVDGVIMQRLGGFFVAGPVITIKNNGLIPTGNEFTAGNLVDGCYGQTNQAGIWLDVRAEYNRIVNNMFNDGGYGIYDAGGNNTITGNNFSSDGYGIYLDGGSNNGHGLVTGNLVNHCGGDNLHVNNVTLGMSLVNNHFYAGTITIISSDGINIIGGDIDATTITATSATNCNFNFVRFVNPPTWSVTTSSVNVISNTQTGLKMIDVAHSNHGLEISSTDGVAFYGGNVGGGTNSTQQHKFLQEVVGATGIYDGQRDLAFGSFRSDIPVGNVISDPNQVNMQSGTGSGFAVFNGSRYAMRINNTGNTGFGTAFGNMPNASALIDMVSDHEGLLIPRLTTTQRNTISSPATSLLLYNTTVDSFQYRTSGGAWQDLGAGGSSTPDTLKVKNVGTAGALNILYTNLNDSLFGKKLLADNGLSDSTSTDSTNHIILGGNLNQNTAIYGVEGAYNMYIGQMNTITLGATTTTIPDGTLSLRPFITSSSTFNMDNAIGYIFTGTTGTGTLPSAGSSVAGRIIHIKNRGSGNLTIVTTGAANEIYDTSATNTLTVTPGSAIILYLDGTYYNKE